MSDKGFARLMFVLLLLTCALLAFRDQQLQRSLDSAQRELDNLHGRMNAAGLLDVIATRQSVGRDGSRKRFEFDLAHLPISFVLKATSNDDLSRIGEVETRR